MKNTKTFTPDNFSSDTLWHNDLMPLMSISEGGSETEIDLNDFDSLLITKEKDQMYFYVGSQKFYIIKSQQERLWQMCN